ncbi:MAG: cobalt-precorrin 5A hydrolase [Oceanospirillaceae bacterium]|jgi:cobalt-precorrin 5A hydrolase
MKIISLTPPGYVLAKRLAALMQQEAHAVGVTDLSGVATVARGVPSLLHKPQPFREVVQQAFSEAQPLIFICATGIIFRTLADVIDNKLSDPPVLAIDEAGKFVIPLLSGHEGGANELASQVAKMLGAQLVSTTANAYLKPLYTAGMGCERHCPKEDLFVLLKQSLKQANLEIEQISALASIDIKDDEVGLIELAKQLNIPFLCYSASQLNTVQNQLQTPSEYVFKTVGTYGVAESAALVSAQLIDVNRENKVQDGVRNGTRNDGRPRSSELMLSKQKSKVATCAIGRSYQDS